MEQAVSDLTERARYEGKEILMEGQSQEVLFCDPEWTIEAVANLVKNGLDHTKEGGVVRVSWNRSPAVFRLCVEDNGCGIDGEDIHHIFKQFYRSKTSGDRQGGAGLGLSLAKSTVEGQGGTLSVESRTGEGSIFQMNFLILYKEGIFSFYLVYTLKMIYYVSGILLYGGSAVRNGIGGQQTDLCKREKYPVDSRLPDSLRNRYGDL